MKHFARLIVLVALIAVFLSGCGLTAETGPMDFDSLARLVPADAGQTFFLDLKPAGEAGRYWQRIRDRLEANPASRDTLNFLLAEFQVQDLGLNSFLMGPAVNGYLDSGTPYVILQVNSSSAARDAVLLQNRDNLDWDHEDYQGKTLYHRRSRYLYGQPQWRAFAAYDGLIVVVTSAVGDPVEDLKTLVGLTEEQSLASLPVWKALRTRLPASPMGLIFVYPGESPQPLPEPVGDVPPSEALGQRMQALAAAAIPEKDGMRVEMAGRFFPGDDVPAIIRRVVQLPGVDPASWTHLPANTAVAVSTHEAATVWPILKDMFGLPGLDVIRDTAGLDLETDLFATDGPFSGNLAVALTPPFADQPVSQGLIAGQLLLLGRDASPAQMAAVQAAMESRGAILSPKTVGDVELQVQVGTEAMGYAISFGFDGDVFVLGTSPAIVEDGASAARAGNGLVANPAFQSVLSKMPQSPTFFLYLNTPAFVDLRRANLTAYQYEQSPEISDLEAFDAIGLGLNFSPDVIEGTVQFYIRED
jgi:hypothetical protein